MENHINWENQKLNTGCYLKKEKMKIKDRKSMKYEGESAKIRGRVSKNTKASQQKKKKKKKRASQKFCNILIIRAAPDNIVRQLLILLLILWRWRTALVLEVVNLPDTLRGLLPRFESLDRSTTSESTLLGLSDLI